MKEKKAVYGFVLSLFEYIETIPSLWDATKSVLALSMPCETVADLTRVETGSSSRRDRT